MTGVKCGHAVKDTKSALHMTKSVLSVDYLHDDPEKIYISQNCFSDSLMREVLGRSGTQFGTQNCAERAVEAVDAVRNLLSKFSAVGYQRTFDTVGVWGSNPHAPTKTFNNLHALPSFSVTPEYAI
jgi:hypothetical protein